jgi:hypothetical protein
MEKVDHKNGIVTILLPDSTSSPDAAGLNLLALLVQK